MSIKLPRPNPFWDIAGPHQNYKNWIILFNGWLALQDVDRTTPLTDYQKNNMLLLSLGSEGMKVFSPNPALQQIETKTYVEFSAAVLEAFVIPTNPVRAHYDLFNRRQATSESVSEFLSALRSLMADCTFCERCSKGMLATMLVVGCNNSTVQEKLLTEPNINFERFLAVLKAEESAREASSHIQSESSAQKIKKFPPNKAKKPSKPTTTKPSAPKNKFTCEGGCERCGKEHALDRDSCPARDARCFECGNAGHYGSKCKTRKSKRKQWLQESERQASSNQIKLDIKAVHQGHQKIFEAKIEVSDGEFTVYTSAEVDTGSDISTITEATYRKIFGSKAIPPLPDNVKLSTYDKSPLKVLGVKRLLVSFRERSADVACYIVPDGHNQLLGKDAMEALRLYLDPVTFQVSAVSADPFVKALFGRYASLTAPGIGKYPGYQHIIKLKDGSKPEVAKLRSVPLALKEAVSKEIRKMVEDGIWESCQKSEWVHGMVVIPKPTPGQVRITTDLSPLNKDIVADHYPLPTAEDLFLRFRDCKVFSRLDLTKAYFHVELAPESRDLTATVTPEGVYRYKRLLMGMTDSGSVFQRRIDDTLNGIDRVAASIDDILIGGLTQADHDKRLEEVLKRLAEKDFRVNPEKCEFNKGEVVYLGQIISSKGIKPNPRRADAVKHAPAPTSKGELTSFLGFVNYYNSAVPNLAALCEPMRCLVRKDVKFEWTAECQRSFEEIKARITNVTLKAIFDPSATTILATDASDKGIGAVLLQVQNGQEVPISFASRTLQPSERNYAVNEAEALACVWGCERFDKFLVGRHFTLRTDHSALKSLLQNYGTSRKAKKFHRWYERLQGFDYEVEYRKGSENVLADAMSRLPQVQATQKPAVILASAKAIKASLGVTFKALGKFTTDDKELDEFRQLVKDRNRPPPKNVSSRTQAFLRIRHDAYEHKAILYRRDGRIILPKGLVKYVLQEAHRGHPGVARMKRSLREVYWWPRMSTEIEEYVKTCDPCQRSQKSVGRESQNSEKFVPPSRPWERLAIDITGPFFTAPQSHRFIVVLIDHYSGYPFYTLSQLVTTTKIVHFLEDIFAQYGYPDSILSDNGPQFTSQEFEEYLSTKGILHRLTPVYSPQTNGRVENFNRYVKFGIQTMGPGSKFDERVRELMQSYRAIPLSDEGKSPSELLHGWRMRLPYEPAENAEDSEPNKEQPVATPPLRSPPMRLWTRGPYRVGDNILIKRPHVLKGQSPLHGPFKITEVLGRWTYKCSDGKTWNARSLRRYNERQQQDEQEDVGPAAAPQPQAQQVPQALAHQAQPQLRRSARQRKPPDRYKP